jgi:excisionase family DNA binding protein
LFEKLTNLTTIQIGKAIIIKMDEVDLTSTSRQVKREEIKSLFNEMYSHADDNTLLSRKETAKMMHISLPTLHRCQKEGRIPLYRIGGRVLYKKTEIMKAILVNIKWGRNS